MSEQDTTPVSVPPPTAEEAKDDSVPSEPTPAKEEAPAPEPTPTQDDAPVPEPAPAKDNAPAPTDDAPAPLPVVAPKKLRKKRGSVSDMLVHQKKIGMKKGHKFSPSLGGFSEQENVSAVKESSDQLAEIMSGGKKEGEAAGESWDLMRRFLDALREISSEIEPDLVADKIIKETCTLLGCDRATLFFVDAEAYELVLIIAEGADNIRLPIGKGIAGSVAQTGKSENIPDAYKDERFSSGFDKASGYKTTSILATPVRDPSGEIVAVLQCINKKDKEGGMTGVFSRADQIILDNMAAHTGIVLRNAKMYESERASKLRVATLLEIIKMLHSGAANTHSLIFTLSNRSHDLVDGDRCTLYLVDQEKEQLVVMQGDIDIRFPKTVGLAGHVATSGAALNIEDAYLDKRFSKAIDMKTGYRTKSMLVLPIFGAPKSNGQPGAVCGVLQIINKMDDSEVFCEEDQELLETLLRIAGPILERSKFFKSKQKTTEMDMAMGVHNTPTPTKFKPSLGGLSSFAE